MCLKVFNIAEDCEQSKPKNIQAASGQNWRLKVRVFFLSDSHVSPLILLFSVFLTLSNSGKQMVAKVTPNIRQLNTSPLCSNNDKQQQQHRPPKEAALDQS